MLISFLMSAAVFASPLSPIELEAAVVAERAAAPACVHELNSAPEPGAACDAYQTQAHRLYVAGGMAALKQGEWPRIQTLQRQRWIQKHNRDYGAALSVSTAPARY